MITRAVRDERGVGVVTALMITLVVFALGATWTRVGLHQVESSSFERHREQSLHAAEAGINLALSQLAGDYDWEGSAGVVALGDDTGEYEVTVTPVDPTDPNDLDRYIVAKGYAPNSTAAGRAVRQLEQQVRLTPTDGFSFALFASPGGIVGQNNSTITGDVYSAGNIALANSAKYFGDITALGAITTTNNNTIGGTIHGGEDVTVENAVTTVQGDVLSGESATIKGSVAGNVQAAADVTIDGGTVGGSISPNNPPPDPVPLSQPTFTWNAANYTPTGTSWSTAEGFSAHWSANRPAFSGHHRITDTATVALDQTWTMSGDVTIVSDGPIELSRDIANGTSGKLTLTVVSLLASDPAIKFTNNVTLPADIEVVLFAPGGAADFSQLKDFHGVVYAEEINLSQQFTLSYAPPSVPGFTWGASSASHYDVELLAFREVVPDA